MQQQKDLRIAVSAENTQYMAWQSWLLCSSCRDMGFRPPIVLVHRVSRSSLLPQFRTLIRHGVEIVEAPSFRSHPLGDFPPRNELGSLLMLAGILGKDTGSILFCEADMLFVRAPNYKSCPSGEFYSYLDYQANRISDVVRRFNIPGGVDLLNAAYPIGVPYLLPAMHLEPIASRWIEVLDSFAQLEWIDIMYAFGIALASLSMPVNVTQEVDTNFDPDAPATRSVIHYCYGDTRWNKRDYIDTDPIMSPRDRKGRAKEGTVLAQILHSISFARTEYERSLAHLHTAPVFSRNIRRRGHIGQY